MKDLLTSQYSSLLPSDNSYVNIASLLLSTDVEEDYARYNVAICCQTRPSCISILLDQLDAQSHTREGWGRAKAKQIPNIASLALSAGIVRVVEEEEEEEEEIQQLECLQIDIVKVLGTCSLEVPELRKLIQIVMPAFPSPHSYFKDVTGVASNRGRNDAGSDGIIVPPPVRPRHLVQIVLAMREMMSDTNGPRSFLFLGGGCNNMSSRVTGEDDGIIVPSFRKWPFSRGYTFTCWLRPTGCLSWTKRGLRPCLVRLVDRSGRGFEIHLKGRLDRTPSVSDCDGSKEEVVRKGDSDNDVDLVVVVLPSSGKAPIETTICRALSSKQWGFVAVKHLAMGFGSRGELSVFCAIRRAEGIVVSKGGWYRFVKRYPHITSNKGTILTVRFACNEFEGELGPLYMFEEALTDDQVEGIHLLGPNYNLDFHPSSIQHFLREETKLALPLSQMGPGDTAVLKSSLSSMGDNSLSAYEISKETRKLIITLADIGSHLVFAYNSALRRRFKDTLLLLDGVRLGLPPATPPRQQFPLSRQPKNLEKGNPPHQQQPPLLSPPFASFHAKVMSPTALAVNTCDIRDSIDSAGGVELLLPLFALIDLPVTLNDFDVLERSPQAMSDVEHCGNEGQKMTGGYEKASTSYDANFELMESLLALLSGALRDDTASTIFIRKQRGLELLTHCLENSNVKCVGSGSLVRICELIVRLKGWHRDWADQAISCLLANFNIWTYSPEDAQIFMVRVLQSLCESQPGRMRCVVGVQRLLDGLSLTFKRKCAMPDGRRTDVATLNKVHTSLLDCVYSMVTHGEGINTLEAHAIFSQLFSYLDSIAPPTSDNTTMTPMDDTAARNTLELLQLVLRLLQSPSRLKGGILCGAHRFVLAAGTYCSSFASPSLLSAKYPPIRMLSLLCLSNIVKICMEMQQQQLNDEPPFDQHSEVYKPPFNGDDDMSDAVKPPLKDDTQLSVCVRGRREKEAQVSSRTVVESEREEHLSNILLSIIGEQHRNNEKRSVSTQEVLELHSSPWSVAGLGVDLDGGCELLNILLMAQQLLNSGMEQDMHGLEAIAVLSIFESLALGNIPEEIIKGVLHLKIGELEGKEVKYQNINKTKEIWNVGSLDSFFTDGLSNTAEDTLGNNREEDEKHVNAQVQWLTSTGHSEHLSGIPFHTPTYGIICLPAVLPSLLHCLAYYTLSPSERLKWVKRFLCMITCHGNEGAFIGIDNWQRYLLDVIISSRNRKEEAVESICIRLLAWVSMHALLHNRDESVVRHTMSLLRAEMEIVSEVSEGDSSSHSDNNKNSSNSKDMMVYLELVGIFLLSSWLRLMKREVSAIAEVPPLPWWVRYPREVIVSMETLKCRSYIVQKGIWAISALIVEFIALSPVEKRTTDVVAVDLSLSHEKRSTATQFTLLHCTRLDNPNLWQLLESLLGTFSPMGDILVISGRVGAADSENFRNIVGATENSQIEEDGSSLLDDGREGNFNWERVLPQHFASSAFKDNKKHKDHHHKGRSGGDALAGAGGVPWMLLRLLLGVFIRGGDVKREGSGDVSHNSLLALQMCISLLNGLRANGYHFYSFEVVNTIAVFTASLRKSDHSPTSPWSVGGLQLLVKCLQEQDESDIIKSLLLSATEQNPSLSRIRFGSQGFKGGFWQFLNDMLLNWKFPNSHSGIKKDSRDAIRSTSHDSMPCHHMESVYDITAETSNLELNSLTIANLTCDTLCRSLRVELDFGDSNDDPTTIDESNNKAVAFTESHEYVSFWEIWDAAMAPVFQEATAHEQAALKLRVDASNQHAHTVRLLDNLRVKRMSFKASCRERMSGFSETAMGFRKKEKERAASLIETKVKDDKRRKGMWESVLARLSVERGMWGTGAAGINFDGENRIAGNGEVTTTSWILDEWEDDLTQHLRLRRNPCRFSHMGASARGGGGLMIDNKTEKYSHNMPQQQQHQERRDNDIDEGNKVTMLNTNEEQHSGVSVSVPEGTTNNERWSLRSTMYATNLWRDLYKYHAIGHTRRYDALAVEYDEPFEVEEEESPSSPPQFSSMDILHMTNADNDAVILSMPCQVIRPYYTSFGCFYISKQQCAFVQDTQQQNQRQQHVPTQDNNIKITSIFGGGYNSINSNRRHNSPLHHYKTTVWALNDIRSVEILPYRYQPVGLEFFFYGSPPLLLVMQTEEDCR